MPKTPGEVAIGAVAATASAAVAYVGYRIVGWLGVGTVGLLIVLVAIQADMDDAAPIGSQQNTNLFATTLSAQNSESRAEKAGRIAGQTATRRAVQWAKLLGSFVLIVGDLGFVLRQWPG